MKKRTPWVYAPDSARLWRMIGLTRDGMAEPVPRYRIFDRERGRGKTKFPCPSDHDQDWQPFSYRLIPNLLPGMCDHTFMYICEFQRIHSSSSGATRPACTDEWLVIARTRRDC